MNNALGFLGILRRANRLFLGQDALSALSRGKVSLLIIASDLSEKSKKEVGLTANYDTTKHITYSSKEELGKALGINEAGIIGLKDNKASKAFLEKIGGNVNGESTTKSKKE